MSAYSHILVALDESPMAYAAVEQALSLAQDLKSQVTIMSVIAIDPFVGVDFYKVAPAITDYFMQAEKNAKERLEDVKQSFVRDGLSVNIKLIHGVSPSQGIIQVADEVNADLIIMGSHGRTGIQKVMLGSVAQNVLTQSPIPVLIVKV
ncbi:universal stress protein [Acinetobacter cumulans]|jgi:nucleotide-binding universal stress UspA family protein|uniref:Universal stress protein n=1 Tax=Acinetobacter cumulans TaxID=2136182 RepID=A0A3A8FZE8_9GAMM|nr:MULTISPECIES: universal stress protein [Acinetobacter]RKG46666.1 universal stress protein [Acinetobacter cumulans]RKG51166.1 universal stress protein [Acinetobacter cumulans]RLL34595.1 universal stress protein [Acinetobacter cumulans]RLL48873.1 universal stress protein [Acinetobacter cumulans]RZG62059.1 universal stress protein [Acinetobacter sp. WCHAc060006]